MPYSMEFRIAVANDYEETGSSIVTAEKFGCSESWGRRLDELVAARGCCALPPYSPDYNPIEMAISKIKTLLRSMQERTVAKLKDAIGTAMASITAQDAINYIQHCRYADTNG